MLSQNNGVIQIITRSQKVQGLFGICRLLSSNLFPLLFVGLSRDSLLPNLVVNIGITITVNCHSGAARAVVADPSVVILKNNSPLQVALTAAIAGCDFVRDGDGFQHGVGAVGASPPNPLIVPGPRAKGKVPPPQFLKCHSSISGIAQRFNICIGHGLVMGLDIRVEGLSRIKRNVA